MKNLKVISFTHKNLDLKDLGNLVISDEDLDDKLSLLKSTYDIPEVFYIGTCNRVEFAFYGDYALDRSFLQDFIHVLDYDLLDEQRENCLNGANSYEGQDALNHLFRMSCSLESLVVGEKEILAQVRKSYERCRKAKFTGDFLRMVMDRLVKTAKEVYTHTHIARNPVSIVSLAYRKLRDLKMDGNPRFIIIGAGETNQNLAKYIQKHKDSQFTVFNRSIEAATALANELGGKAYPLSELENYKEGFDVLITCTGSTDSIITNDIYTKLLAGDDSKKTIIDLAVPNDVCPEVIKHHPINYIEVYGLQAVASKNLQERYDELVHAERIIEENIAEFLPELKQRRVELAMREVPEKVKEIKSFALNTVFAQELSVMDEDSRAVLEKVMNYMEKKYISVPMIMAKDILVKNS
ncbi:MAG TPA: glutamyl-tRNA reductase [Sphingobacteriaceae bacterium]|nr:glutamyl-tRNA reductase [Sphingobacteriaceae bacterium]